MAYACQIHSELAYDKYPFALGGRRFCSIAPDESFYDIPCEPSGGTTTFGKIITEILHAIALANAVSVPQAPFVVYKVLA
jgi:hypothetical protein